MKYAAQNEWPLGSPNSSEQDYGDIFWEAQKGRGWWNDSLVIKMIYICTENIAARNSVSGLSGLKISNKSKQYAWKSPVPKLE